MLSRKQVIDPYAQVEHTKQNLAEMQKEKTPYTVEIFGVPIVVHENVFSPKYAEETLFFIEKMASPKDKKVLDMGTGMYPHSRVGKVLVDLVDEIES